MAGRVRRTNAEIDNAVMTELEKLVIRNGFDKVLVTELMANASLEPPVFYRRYGSIDNLYDKLAQRYDFWINDTIKMSELSDLGPKSFFAKTLKTLEISRAIMPACRSYCSGKCLRIMIRPEERLR